MQEVSMKKAQNLWRKGIAVSLTFAMCAAGLDVVPIAGSTAQAAEKITISNADELARIGMDASYPMSGDYVLTEDIDLSTVNWTPIGGCGGDQYGLVSGARVFNGTFDGAGHVISGLTIDFDGSKSGYSRNQSGLFAMIGSDSAQDYAEVKNIVFTDVSIKHNLGGGDSIGALSGDANGYTKIDNIAVLGGSIEVTADNGGDLIGVGGITGQVRTNNPAVLMTNLYNGADVTVSSAVGTSPVRCGGILGRIHQDAVIGALSSCLNVGKIVYRGAEGYGVNGYSSNVNAASNTTNITDCYYLAGTGKGYSTKGEISGEQLKSESVKEALGADYWYLSKTGEIMPLISDGKVTIPIPSPTFAEGDKASSVTKNFTLPLTYEGEDGPESIAWTSSDTDVILINGSVAEVKGVLADTAVTLTAVTSVSGEEKKISVTVCSNLTLEFDQEYAKVGRAMKASVTGAPQGTDFSYTWKVNGSVVSSTDTYTPTQDNLNQFITVTARLQETGASVDETKIYCSKLPVVYIDTADGYGITSKTVYKDATMRIQGNDRFNSANSTLYDGDISIRGRGNSTWNTGYSKLPYKIKLDTKTNLLGFGNSKHWALLANYMDESLLRNTTSYDLSGAMGMVYLKSTHVDVILNGVYAGNYQLVGNVRIEESRANIYDWEDCAGDVAKAIGKAEGISGDARDALEDHLAENLGWITSDSVTYNGKTYKISDYYQDIPKDADGNVDVSGGFLFELDEYYDEVSKFRTSNNQPIMFKNPEFANTNTTLFNSARNYIQAVEDSVTASDFYTTYDGGKKHYTDLVDLDSLVRYLILNEFYWNTETMKKSTYMYKDLGGKLYIGPVWDMDWTSNSIVSQGETSNYSVWMVNQASQNAQADSWYKTLIKDPYFVTQMYECYQENRQNFEDIVKTGGIIDQEKEYLAESAQANYEAGYLRHRSDFETETERLRTFLKNRLNWLDAQFTSVNKLLTSLGKFSASSNVSVTADVSAEKTTDFTAKIQNNSSVKKVGFYVNGILQGTADVSNGQAVLTVDDGALTKKKGGLNTIQVRGMDAGGNLLSGGSITNYAVFEKEIAVNELSGTVSISGDAMVGSVLTAAVADTNNTGTLAYQWMADGNTIAGANAKSYKLTEKETGKVITVVVTSSVESGSIVSAATPAVREKEELKNDHIIINQIYGGGGNTDVPVSHAFIELYNPTDSTLGLDGCTLGYFSSRSGMTEEVKLVLSGNVPAHTSYLVRCASQNAEAATLKYTVSEADKDWDQVIDNKQYRVILYRGDAVEDGVSQGETPVEGAALAAETTSKQKSLRRKDFADTNDNASDFTTISYRDDALALTEYYPRSLSDGAWGSEDPNPPVPDNDLKGSVTIRGNAIAGANLYADDALIENNTGELKCQWMADGKAIAGETGLFLTLKEAYVGKRISVKVTSTVQTGSLTSEQTEAVVLIKAQREHLIINQVYGGGGKGSTPISHSFIELYNPTSEAVDLIGYRVKYTSKGKEQTLELSGTIPSRGSWLIQGAAEDTAEPDLVYTVDAADTQWELAISNKQYSIVLQKDGVQIDGVAVNEDPVEGDALVNPEGDEIISKKKSIRRISFIDTDNNAADFEVLNYAKITDAILERSEPRSFADGSWGLEETENPVKKYTVTFDNNGIVSYLSVVEGEKAAEPDIPVREGYRFLGWYLGDGKFDFNTAVTKDMTLTAKWEKQDVTVVEYQVTFEYDGAAKVVTVKEGEKVVPIGDPVKPAYEFTGWYLGDALFDFDTPVMENLTLRAGWKAKDMPDIEKEYCDVTFDVDGNRTTMKVKAGETAARPETPAKSGYTFLGWYLDHEVYDFTLPVQTDLVLTAKWEQLQTLAAPAVTAVKSMAGAKTVKVQVKVSQVAGAQAYQIYRRKGSSTVLLGQTSTGTFYDEKPVSGKISYLAKAVGKTQTSAFGTAKSVTLPKATKKVTVTSLAGKKTVTIKWRKVKGATGYIIYRSTKKNSGYKRIAVVKKGTKLTYTDKKGLKKNKKYYYRVVTVKKKTYSPARTSKAVKVK